MKVYESVPWRLSTGWCIEVSQKNFFADILSGSE